VYNGGAFCGGGSAEFDNVRWLAAIEHAIRVKKRHEQKIFQTDGVVGTGVGLSEAGQPVIEIYLTDKQAKAQARIPAALDNVPVRVGVTGRFEAF